MKRLADALEAAEAELRKVERRKEVLEHNLIGATAALHEANALWKRLEADNAALLDALQRLVQDNEKRGLASAPKSWAKTVAGMEPFRPKDHPGEALLRELTDLRAAHAWQTEQAAGMLRELTALRALRAYAAHKRSCEIVRAEGRWYDDPAYASCTCGLKAALVAWEANR